MMHQIALWLDGPVVVVRRAQSVPCCFCLVQLSARGFAHGDVLVCPHLVPRHTRHTHADGVAGVVLVNDQAGDGLCLQPCVESLAWHFVALSDVLP